MQPPASPAAHPGPAVPPPPLRPVRRESRWLPAIGALAVILFVSLGGFVLAGEPTAAGQELTGGEGTPGAPVSVGPISVRPAPGWAVAERIPDPPQLRLSGGTAQLYVLVLPAPDPAEELLRTYVDEALAPQARQLSVSPVRPVELPSGQPASLLSYVGSFDGVVSPLEGEVLAMVSPAGTPVVFDGWAPEGLWVAARDEVRTMTTTAEIA
jgi:hypothetical protein